MEERKHIFFSRSFLISILVVTGFALYSFSLGNKMFWDDDDFILNNAFVKDFKHIPDFFSQNVIAGSGLVSDYWRPALLFVFSLQWHAWGDWNVGYHLVNTIFHVGDSVLLFLLFSFLFKKKWLAFIVALIFLIHPLQTEAVVYANSLGDSLSFFWMLVGMISYLGYVQKSKFLFAVLAIISYGLALMSKETAVILPALFLLIDWYCHKDLDWKKSLPKVFIRVLPFFLLAFVYVGLRGTVLNFKNSFNLYNEINVFTGNIFVRIATFFKIITVYLGLIFWPQTLHMERTLLPVIRFDWLSVLGGLVSAGFLGVAISIRKKIPEITFGIFWFFFALAPTSNIAVPINGLLYEHWLYVPLIGIALIVALLFSWSLEKFSGGRKYKFLVAFGMVVVMALSVRTALRIRQWRDAVTFYNQTIKYAPHSYRILNNLGMAYADEGENEKAVEYYSKAVQEDPSNPVAIHNLGNIYKVLGLYEKAVIYYEQAIELNPKFTYSYPNLIGIYIETKQWGKAREISEKLFSVSGPRVEVLESLVYVCIQQNDFNSAKYYANIAVQNGSRKDFVLNLIN